MGGRFLQAFCVGFHSALCLVFFITRHPTLFLVNGLLIMYNVWIYRMPKKDEPNAQP